MKSLVTYAVLGMFAAAMAAGCEASGSVGNPNDTSAQHKEVQEKTVTDANGNVVQHSETVHQDNTTP